MEAVVKQHVWSIVMAEAARRVANRVAGARSEPAAAEHVAAAMFARAMEQNSGRELDWLLLYCRVANAGQRRYCLERALAINPNSEVALAALHRMPLAD